MRTLLVTLTMCLLALPVNAKYSGGTGEPDDPYRIATAADLIALGETPADYDKHFILTTDIDLDPNLPGRKVFDRAVIDAPPFGALDGGVSFTGIFHGRGHRISHLMIEGGGCLGLFGQLGSAAEVRNLGLVRVSITGSSSYVGGLVGDNRGTVTQCYCTGVATGRAGVGGLVGVKYGGALARCYSTVVVSGVSDVGGLVGDDFCGTVTQCYSTGAVKGTSNVGGLVGFSSGDVLNSVWDTGTSGESASAGGVGLTTDEMMDPYMLGLNGFANDPNWVLDFGRDYPRLAWEGTSGQVVPEPDIDRLGGAGTSEDPYRIDTAEQLIFLGRASVLCYKHLALRADLDLARDLPSENVSASAVIPAFAGVFDGEGHTISHLTIKGPKNLGLFGHVTSKAEVRDVKIADVNIAGSGIYVGGLIGRNDGTVIRCDSTGSVSGGSIVGGLVGENKGTMTHCRATGSVSGSYNVGGLVGSNWGNIAASHSSASVDGDGSVGGIAGENVGSMTHCYSTGPVSVGEPYEGGGGGLVGENYATVVSCYSTSAVSGNRVVGGLVGENYATVSFSYSVGPVSGEDYIGGLAGSNEGHLTQCYSIGRVSGNSNVGGLVGGWRADTVSPPVVIACFWDVQTSGQTWSDGSTGKATAEMQTASTFLDAGWDFVGEVANGTDDIWWINEGKDYPRLWWEGPAGMVFVDIPAGTFEMGDHDIAGYRNDQKPVHAVTLDGFQMSQCEITNAQYAQFLNAAMAAGLIQVVNGVVYASSDANLAWAYCDTYASSPYSQIVYSQGRFSVRSRDGLAMSDHPVARVSWYGAAAFCDHYGYHLPTEAQWEYAARGGYHDPYYRYPWGSDDIDCSLANCKTDSGFCNPLGLTSWPFTVPVGYYGPQGAYGLCDMSGNLWEWCQDWYDAGYYAVSPKSNPAGPETGTTRVLRGGAWDVHGDSCHVADRSVADPLVRGQVVGFRVCR